MKDEIANQALTKWGINGADFSFVAHRENIIYRVETETRSLALRIHRRGYRSDSELTSELDWMAALSRAGISVPAPRRSASGNYLEHIGGHQVDILTWLPGDMLSTVLADHPASRIQTMGAVAREAARLHNASDAWTVSTGFDRPDWGLEGLVGESPNWGRFWENPAVGAEEAELFDHFRGVARHDLTHRHSDLDHGLIHADLLGENVLVEGDSVHFIDFDDGGWGYRLFELTTALIRQIDAPDFADLRRAMFESYNSVRPLRTDAFELMLALRATTYVGWIADRPDLPDAAERNVRNAAIAKRLINDYLSTR